MVEGASEVAKPDYLSLVNKSGSGFNVSELVDAIVGSEIEPKRSLQTAKKDRTENAISGIGFLKSQANTTQSNFETLKSDVFFDTIYFGLLLIGQHLNQDVMMQTCSN